MPSDPQPLPQLVRVSHPVFGEKYVRRSQVGSLSSRWKRVGARIRSASKAADTSTTETGTTSSPDTSKED